MKTASKIYVQHSNSWGSSSENVNLEKSEPESTLDFKMEGLKKKHENLKRKSLNGRMYKKLLKLWASIPQESAGLPRKGDEVSGKGDGVTKSNGCAKADIAVKRSFSPMNKLRTACDSEKEISDNNAAPSHEPNSNSHSKDTKDFATRRRIEWVEVEQQSNDKESRYGKLDAEHDEERVACSICALEGELLYCDGKGCNKKFHLSCVDPPFNFAPPGVWHCAWCVLKKIDFGIYSVSEGIGSILDAREVNVGDQEVQKQYMVKYRGLAHVHNCWIPERQLEERAPSLLAHYKKQVHGIGWKAEWAMPHRLLLKRQLHLPKQCDGALDEYKSKEPDCQNEWLVKWKGLGYDRATWELETASFLKSPEAAILMRDFERRHKDAKGVPRASEEDEERKTPTNGMEETQHEDDINKLRKCWSKRQSSVLFDNEERFAKVVMFMLSLKDNSLPFLVVTPCGSLSEWEAEFSRHKSSNIVVYNGNNDVRSSIRSLEFQNEHGCIMFQVLLSTPIVVIEDLKILEGIKWRGVIADNCQKPIIHSHLSQIKALPTDMRLLIASDHILERRYVYNRLLYYINPELQGEKENASDFDDSNLDDNISKLKEKLARFTAYECKHQAPRFSEYWVPVRLSNVQLEQYCAALLSKSMFLCSSPQNVLSNSLHKLLVLERECCGHPYLLDRDHSLRISLTKDIPMAERLNAEIEMSGKLQLLERFLLHIKEQGLRVLIVFQPSVGPRKISVGDVLDDFVLQRFGKDSYARIGDKDVIRSKKRAALESFNQRESKQFVFLLEKKACVPSIKLSSVDTVILFDSHWDPLDDLKALHKISLQSQFQQLKVFRLYSIHSVEEKVLILAKQGLAPDNLKTISRKTCHSLLTWGAFHLFYKLDQFHAHNDSDQSPQLATANCFLNEVESEFSALLPNNTENTNPDTKIISKVQQEKGTYLKNASLYGEVEAESTDSISLIERMMHNESTIVFWKNLLEGRCLKWKFLSNSSNIDQTEHIKKLPEETQSTEKVVRICREMVNGAPIQFEPLLKRKRSFNGVRKGSSSACKKSKLQERNDKKATSDGKIGRPSKTIADYILERKKSRSLQDRHDKKAVSNGKTGLLSKRIKVDNKGSSLEKESQFCKADKLIIRDLPASEMISSRLQVPQHKSLEDSSDQSLDIATSVNKTEQFPSNHKKEILLSCNSKTPHISFEVPHSTLLDPKQRDLEIMEKVIKQAIKIKQDKKSQLRAEFEKEIDQVTEKYVKLLEEAEVVLSQKTKELETYYRKVIESKSLVRSVSVKSDRAQTGKKFGIQQGAKRCDQISKQSLESSNSTETTTNVKISFASSPTTHPSPTVNFLPHPITSHHSPALPLVSPPVPTCNPKIPHKESLTPAFGIRAMAPHLQRPCVPAEVSPICYSQTQNQMLNPHLTTNLETITETTSKNPILGPGKLMEASSLSPSVLPHPAVPSSHPPGSTYQPVFGIRAQVPPLAAAVSQPCHSQAQNGNPSSHLATSSKSATETTLERTLVGPENANDISSLSTSELLSRLFSQMTKK